MSDKPRLVIVPVYDERLTSLYYQARGRAEDGRQAPPEEGHVDIGRHVELQRHVANLCKQIRMPNAEYVADAHNRAVAYLRALVGIDTEDERGWPSLRRKARHELGNEHLRQAWKQGPRKRLRPNPKQSKPE